MKKRIVCAILALILMIGLIPAGAITASAAGRSVSESAITVLKNLEGYSKFCNAQGYIGYGTKCTQKGTHGNHAHKNMEQLEADKALRAALKDLDTAVNNFASRSGLSLTQGQHDALVLFSFDNGTAWMQGTGSLQSAVKAKLTGAEFLTRICMWNPDTFDDNRRMVEANMYLNGKYSSTRPANFFRVDFNPVGYCNDTDDGHESDSSFEITYEDEVGKTITETIVTPGAAPGTMAEGNNHTASHILNHLYFVGNTALTQTPSKEHHIFMGWYTDIYGEHVATAKPELHGTTLHAMWQPNGLEPDDGQLGDEDDVLPDNWDTMTEQEQMEHMEQHYLPLVETSEEFAEKCAPVDYFLTKDQFESDKVYAVPNGRQLRISGIDKTVRVTREYIDSNNIRWGYVEDMYVEHISMRMIVKKVGKEIKEEWVWIDVTEIANDETPNKLGWVKIGKVGTGTTGTTSSGIKMDLTVTVTNTYVRSRKSPSIYATQNGTYYYGAKLRIIDAKEGSGFLWGQVAKSEKDNTGIGWVALMYTNYDQVKDQDKVDHRNDTVVAKATVTVNGYVNVRNSAGTDGEIVAAVPNGTTVDIYEIKYLNGQQWGRCSTGWFCLSYAEVKNLVDTNATDSVGFTSYVFNVTLANTWDIYDAPDGQIIRTRDAVDVNTTISNLTLGSNNITWGKTPYGWVKISQYQPDAQYNANQPNVLTGHANGFAEVHAGKFETAVSGVTVRQQPTSGSDRVDSLSKGVEFVITKLVAGKTTIWGWADKFGESADGYFDTTNGAGYGGWVNMATKNVKRNDGVSVESEPTATGLIATVVGTDMVNVRKTPSMYAGIAGQIPLGTTAVVLPNESGKDGWYKLDLDSIGMDPDKNPNTENWVVDDYLNVREGSLDNGGNATEGTGSATVKTGKGIIANTYSGVNVRQTPGIDGAFLGKILPGTPVEVTQVKTVGTSDWGKVSQGWVCMDYVTMLTYEQFADVSGNGGSNANVVTKAEPAIYVGEVKAQPTTSTNGNMPAILAAANMTEAEYHYGREAEGGRLIVYTETDIYSDHVRYLNAGDPVTVHEVLTVKETFDPEKLNMTEDEMKELLPDVGSADITISVTSYWARINGGYVRSPGANLNLYPEDEVTYTLVNHDKLYVYEDSRLTTEKLITVEEGDEEDDYVVGSQKYLTIKKGDRVTITEVAVVNGGLTGKVEFADGNYVGWIDLSKMSKGALTVQTESNNNNNNNNNNSSNNNNNGNNNGNNLVIGDNGNTGDGGFVNNNAGFKYTGRVINANTVPLNVRAQPSDTATVVTTLSNGSALVIYETRNDGTYAWGRCDAGWVYLYYVDLTPVGSTAYDAKVVYNDHTIAYTDAACTAVAGTYSRMSVVDIYEENGKMVRTDLGWVNSDNLLN